MDRAPTYELVDDFWRRGVGGEGVRGLVVGSLREGDLWLRDGWALALVRTRLRAERPRDDVVYRHVRAWGRAERDDLPGYDVLILGRHDPYFQSALGDHVRALADRLVGSFPVGPRGALGNSIAYGRTSFTRHDLERGTEDHRRSDIDYGVLQIARIEVAGEARRLVAIAGISALATAGLTVVLEDDRRRAQLLEQLLRTAPLGPGHRPEDYLEVCVRIELPDERHLDRFLDDPQFTFEVEVVSVAGDDGPRVRDQRVRLVLEPHRGGAGGLASTQGVQPVRLTEHRFALLRYLAEHPDGVTVARLREALALAPNDKGSQRLAKRVHDLNLALQVLPQFEGKRAVRAVTRKKDDPPGYKLDAVGVIKP